MLGIVTLSPINDKNVFLNVTQSCKIQLNLGMYNCGSFNFTDGSVLTLSLGVPGNSSSFNLVYMNPVKNHGLHRK